MPPPAGISFIPPHFIHIRLVFLFLTMGINPEPPERRSP
jgi:hypothetical protein